MTTIPGVNNSGSSSGSTSGVTGGNGLADVDMDQFLGLLITELQNQDPMNPMDNAAMLNQISQIREIGSTNKLTDTLTNLAVGQELSMASSLIGKEVSALDSNAKDVKGVVDSVAVQTDPKDKNKRTVQVHIGASIVDIKNIREIVQAGS
ncbi:MAG: flagellar hook capping FlgD N-terminal domain-containing protein [Pirellulaceae bacterium]|nr:flagellar hook capping FlgD N-terminal domain-containing protein [Pirellulaceae bacterium]